MRATLRAKLSRYARAASHSRTRCRGQSVRKPTAVPLVASVAATCRGMAGAGGDDRPSTERMRDDAIIELQVRASRSVFAYLECRRRLHAHVKARAYHPAASGRHNTTCDPLQSERRIDLHVRDAIRHPRRPGVLVVREAGFGSVGEHVTAFARSVPDAQF